MNDEEMAEKFADNINGLELACSLLSAKDKSHAYRLGRYDGFLAGLKASRPKWYKLSEKYPDADKLVRVRLMSGMEHICETCFYEPTEDEIGYGKLVINFYELNGEWVDDNDIITWCEIPKYTEE